MGDGELEGKLHKLWAFKNFITYIYLLVLKLLHF